MNGISVDKKEFDFWKDIFEVRKKYIGLKSSNTKEIKEMANDLTEIGEKYGTSLAVNVAASVAFAFQEEIEGRKLYK